MWACAWIRRIADKSFRSSADLPKIDGQNRRDRTKNFTRHALLRNVALAICCGIGEAIVEMDGCCTMKTLVGVERPTGSNPIINKYGLRKRASTGRCPPDKAEIDVLHEIKKTESWAARQRATKAP